jgi:hypothetical protein
MVATVNIFFKVVQYTHCIKQEENFAIQGVGGGLHPEKLKA